MGQPSQLPRGGEPFDPFFVPDDWARLQYGRLLWKQPAFRKRLLNHWTDPRHPYSDRFQNLYRPWVEMLLESAPEDDGRMDRLFREHGHSLRTIMREIPPVLGSFF
jgi:hypothetical protein